MRFSPTRVVVGLTCVLALGYGVTLGCEGFDPLARPGDGGVSNDVVLTDVVSSDAADAAPVEAACNDLPLYDPVPLRYLFQAAPPAEGGVIPDGTYVQRDWRAFFPADAANDAQQLGFSACWTIKVSGGNVQYVFRVPDCSGPTGSKVTAISGSYVTDGGYFAFRNTCDPTSLGFNRQFSYSMTGDTLNLFTFYVTDTSFDFVRLDASVE